MRWFASVCFVVAALAGCPSTPPPECKVVDESCDQLAYAPTFTNIYNNTLKNTCGSTNSNCHSSRGAANAGNLSFETQALAYEQLLDATRDRVRPGDPGCSELIVRIDSPGEDYEMPPGDPLSGPERCAITQWVLQGAQP